MWDTGNAENFWWVIAVAIALTFAYMMGWLNFIQIIFLSKPSELELKMAVEGIRQIEKLENHIRNGDDVMSMVEFPEGTIFFYEEDDSH